MPDDQAESIGAGTNSLQLDIEILGKEKATAAHNKKLKSRDTRNNDTIKPIY